MKVNVVVPALPSLCETSLIERLTAVAAHAFGAVALLRGAGSAAVKSARVVVGVGAAVVARGSRSASR